jgi:bifunctional non-homologous end joining protein LigD
MSLTLYKKKRNFKHTQEPKGKSTMSVSKLSFVVQRHKSSHLHYDLRLEMNGVLKSWAIPKGPSMNPLDKRLAIMVEDHPYDYKDFEGVIPEGNYGAGIVEIWDKGYYSDIDNSDNKNVDKKLLEELKAGSLKFSLYGKKLKGEFALVRMKRMGENTWLLIKHKDAFAVEEEYNSEDYTTNNSQINKWLREHNSEKLQEAKKRSLKSVPPVMEFEKKK